MRRPAAGHLPREERKSLPKHEACPDCGGKLKHLGEDISEILEYVPATFSKSSDTFGPSWPVPGATRSYRRKPRAGPSSVAWRVRDCWRTS